MLAGSRPVYRPLVLANSGEALVPQLSNPLLEPTRDRQPLIGDDRRDSDSCEKPRAAPRRDADEHDAECEEGAERDVSFHGRKSVYGDLSSNRRSGESGSSGRTALLPIRRPTGAPVEHTAAVGVLAVDAGGEPRWHREAGVRLQRASYRYLRVDDHVYWTSRSLWTPGQNLNRRPWADVAGQPEHEQARLPM
jgi:hypothetical protein